MTFLNTKCLQRAEMIWNIKGETQVALKVTGYIDFVSHIDFGMTIWILTNFASDIKQI